MTLHIEVKEYSPKDAEAWDDLVKRSGAGSVLFFRGFMDYHADRFQDYSLVGFAGGKVVGVFPASKKDNIVTSHAGLTFGSWQFASGLAEETRQRLIELGFDYYKATGVRRLVVREMPAFFNFSELCMQNNLLKSPQSSRLDGAAIDLEAPLEIGIKRRPRIQKSLRQHVFSKASPAYFWPLLEEVLLARHGVRPTHTLQEIEMLYARFPGHIQVHTAHYGATLAAGAVVFLSRNVCHLQYMATSDAGRASHALDGLIMWLIQNYTGKVRWLSMGVSNERDGTLNKGLHDYKMSFGARRFVHETKEYFLS